MQEVAYEAQPTAQTPASLRFPACCCPLCPLCPPFCPLWPLWFKRAFHHRGHRGHRDLSADASDSCPDHQIFARYSTSNASFGCGVREEHAIRVPRRFAKLRTRITARTRTRRAARAWPFLRVLCVLCGSKQHFTTEVTGDTEISRPIQSIRAPTTRSLPRTPQAKRLSVAEYVKNMRFESRAASRSFVLGSLPHANPTSCAALALPPCPLCASVVQKSI